MGVDKLVVGRQRSGSGRRRRVRSFAKIRSETSGSDGSEAVSMEALHGARNLGVVVLDPLEQTTGTGC